MESEAKLILGLKWPPWWSMVGKWKILVKKYDQCWVSNTFTRLSSMRRWNDKMPLLIWHFVQNCSQVWYCTSRLTTWRTVLCRQSLGSFVGSAKKHVVLTQNVVIQKGTIYSGTSIYRSRNIRFPACTVCHFWSRMKFHINNVIYSRIHRSPNYRFYHIDRL